MLRRVTPVPLSEDDGRSSLFSILRGAKAPEALLRDLLSLLPHPAVLVESTGKLVLANELAERMFGYQSDELHGLRIEKLIPERFRGPHSRHFSEYFARPRVRGIGAGLTLSALRKDGTEFPAEISLGPIETAAGTLVLGLIRAIGPSEERDRAIFDQVTAGVVHTALNGRILEVNKAFCELIGYTREEALAVHIHDLMHPADAGTGIDARGRMLARGLSVYQREARLIRKGGAEIWTHVDTSLIRGADGRPVHFISLLHDISAQKRADEQRCESELRFRQLAENISEAFWLADPSKSEVLYVSPAYEGIWGRSAQALLSSPSDWLEAVHPEDRVRVYEAVETKRTAGTYDEEYRIVRPDGSVRWIRDRAFPVRDDDGRVARVAGIAENVTERKNIEAELERTVARLRRAVQSAVEVASKIIELRDPYTHGHEHRVGEIAAAIATEMGLPPDVVEGVRVAGYLHDVGKIGVPTEILSRPSRLAPAELAIVREHAQKSYEILRGMEFPWPVAEAAWQHHERLDGSGYPRGLKGDQIIVEARILAVADTVEAMASHRPYRAGCGPEAALLEMEAGSGTRFDPLVVQACLNLFRVKGYRLPE